MISRMKRYFARAENKKLSPEARVRALYSAVRLLLSLAGYPRKNNMELLAYARSMGEKEPLFGDALERLFTVFYLLEYGGKSLQDSLPESLLQEMGEMRKTLEKRIRKKGFG